MEKKMSIRKISELAGVSPTTVSFVLNNRKGIGEETRKKVMEVIEREQYVPNINSRRLSLNRSFNLGFLTNDNFAMLTDAFASRVMIEAVRKANSLGYSITLIPVSGNNMEKALRKSISQGNIDGAIVIHDISQSEYNALKQEGVPLVVIDSHMKNPVYSCVNVDYKDAAFKVVKHLLDKGHRQIAYVGIESLPDLYVSCLQGYCEALATESISINAEWIMSVADYENGVDDRIAEKFRKGNLPTAIFCANDFTAIGTINGLYKLGLTVPGDVSVISIDDIYLAKMFRPSLTTLKIDIEDMGSKAIEILDRLISGASEQEVHTMKAETLVIRESVGKINI